MKDFRPNGEWIVLESEEHRTGIGEVLLERLEPCETEVSICPQLLLRINELVLPAGVKLATAELDGNPVREKLMGGFKTLSVGETLKLTFSGASEPFKLRMRCTVAV